MNSPFLYLNQRKLTLKGDSERYEEVSSATHKKVAWKLFSALCLCKLYDLSSLPKPANQKLALYTGFCMLVSAATIYRESEHQIGLLTALDGKYREQFEDYVKSSGFEAIA
jgi:hypothetical protein